MSADRNLARHVAVAGVAGPDERGRGQRVHVLAFVPGAGARAPDVEVVAERGPISKRDPAGEVAGDDLGHG